MTIGINNPMNTEQNLNVDLNNNNISYFKINTTNAINDDNNNIYLTTSDKIDDSEKTKPYSTWNKNEFIHWVTNFLSNDIIFFGLETLFNLTEEDVTELLTQMNINKFINLDNKYGSKIYHKLREFDNQKNNRNIENNSIYSYDLLSPSDSNSDSNSIGKPFISSKKYIPMEENIIFIENNKLNKLNTLNNYKIPRISDGKLMKPNKKTKDCVHVWQFCRDLLQQEENSIIEWLDKKNLVFKIKDKDEIALLWGKKKNRKYPHKMTYENMSRGMRHSRVASDYFQVPDKKWKKKFVYQFGPKAIDSCQFLRDCKNSYA